MTSSPSCTSVRRLCRVSWKTLTGFGVLTACILVYLCLPDLSLRQHIIAPILPKEALVNGVPARILLASPFTTRKPFIPALRNPAYVWNGSVPYNMDGLKDNLTIVTAYFDLGTYWKGDKEHGTNFTHDTYLQWMRVFGRIDNPVVAFFEDQFYIDKFTEIRSKLSPSLTKIIKIPKDSLWSFAVLPLIKEIYSIPGYPKYRPGTVIPEYSCIMHAKYELMLHSVLQNPFKTKYFAWTDIGLFRSISSKINESAFSLSTPEGFDDSKVAYGVVTKRSVSARVSDIFHLNRVWVCGCIFVAKANTMVTWTRDYLRATERYLTREIMNTDQQVVYALYNERQSSVQVQEYFKPRKYEDWFHLGYLCKDAGEKKASRRQKSLKP